MASFRTPWFFAKIFDLLIPTDQRVNPFLTHTLKLNPMRLHVQTEQRLPYPVETVLAIEAQ
jgi:hypothetical protein